MISIVMCSRDDTRFRRAQQHFIEVMGQEPHEIIRISDAKSMCEGYNRGFAQAKGDLIIFCHDDIEFLIPTFRKNSSGRWRNLMSSGWRGPTVLSPRVGLTRVRPIFLESSHTPIGGIFPGGLWSPAPTHSQYPGD